jgi:DNA gyrase subunit A
VKEFDDEHFVFMATADGTVKKTALSFFSRPMARGIIAVDLADGDYLIGVALTDGTQEIMLFSDAGKAVRFAESEVRAMGRTAAGVRGMRLAPGQQVISLITVTDESLAVLTATLNGYGKRTRVAEYTRHGRGTQGMIAIQCSERNGKLVTAQLVSDTDEIVLITTGGVLIRTRVSEIREAGRSTQGVKLINLDENETLAGLVRLAEPPEGTNGEGANGHSAGGDAPDIDAGGDTPGDDGPGEPPSEPSP